MKKLTIGYFYPEELNLYGDNGNVEILVHRVEKRGCIADVVSINERFSIGTVGERINLVFMGGGPDSGQAAVYKDLVTDKADFLKKYITDGGVGLYICGAYQLLGHYYKASDGSVLEGLGAFNLYTQHFGANKPRCIGNVSCTLSKDILDDEIFKNVNFANLDTLVGFENHGGRTYLGEGEPSLAKIIKGFGNNSEDSTEGVYYKNSIGTYMHGPILSKNPHLADFLIAKALGLNTLERLDDSLIYTAHKTALDLD